MSLSLSSGTSALSLFHITSLSYLPRVSWLSCCPSPSAIPSPVTLIAHPTLTAFHPLHPSSTSLSQLLPPLFFPCLSFRFPPCFTADRPALDTSWKSRISEWFFWQSCLVSPHCGTLEQPHFPWGKFGGQFGLCLEQSVSLRAGS